MRRPIRSLLALPLLAALGCTESPNAVEVPDADAPQYGEAAGDEAAPVGAEPDNPAIADPGQPPIEADVPSGAGATVDTEEEAGPLSINPPRDLEDQPPAGEPAPAPAPAPAPDEGNDAPAPEAPTADQPEEPGTGQP